MIIETHAYARAGLLGNPSDGYFGKTISIIVGNFGAHVSLYQTPELQIEPQTQDRNVYRNIYDLVDSVSLVGYYGGNRSWFFSGGTESKSFYRKPNRIDFQSYSNEAIWRATGIDRRDVVAGI